MSANNTQIDGDHYKANYQHWDWVCDTEQPYLIACATKYISRWRSKNGIVDLRKSIHYLEKTKEKGISMDKYNLIIIPYTERYVSQLHAGDANIIGDIMFNNFNSAIKKIQDLIDDVIFGADTGYVDQG